MPLALSKVLAKLDRPPFVHNFVRLVAEEPLRTAKNIVNFAVGLPQFQYSNSYSIIKDRIQLRIELEQAIKAVRLKGSPLGRIHNESLVRAFFEWDKIRNYTAANIIEFERSYFKVSREIIVPVSPLVVLRENKKFLPVFLCGWNDLDLSLLQRRLYVSMCEDAFLTLEDYRNSAAEFLFFPRHKAEEPKNPNAEQIVRIPEIWNRGDYQLLSQVELSELMEIFLEGRRIAHQLLSDMAKNGKFDGTSDKQPPASDDQQGKLL